MNTRYVAEFDPGLKVCPGLPSEYSVCLRARARLENALLARSLTKRDAPCPKRAVPKRQEKKGKERRRKGFARTPPGNDDDIHLLFLLVYTLATME